MGLDVVHIKILLLYSFWSCDRSKIYRVRYNKKRNFTIGFITLYIAGVLFCSLTLTLLFYSYLVTRLLPIHLITRTTRGVIMHPIQHLLYSIKVFLFFFFSVWFSVISCMYIHTDVPQINVNQIVFITSSIRSSTQIQNIVQYMRMITRYPQSYNPIL